MGFVATADVAPVRAACAVPTAGRHAGAVAAGVVVVALVLVSGPALASMQVDAFPHATSGGDTPGSGNLAGTVALLDNLAAPSGVRRQVADVRGPFADRHVLAGGDAGAVRRRRLDGRTRPRWPRSLPEPRRPTFTATVEVAGLRTTLLPVPPGTQQVLGDVGDPHRRAVATSRPLPSPRPGRSTRSSRACPPPPRWGPPPGPRRRAGPAPGCRPRRWPPTWPCRPWPPRSSPWPTASWPGQPSAVGRGRRPGALVQFRALSLHPEPAG